MPLTLELEVSFVRYLRADDVEETRSRERRDKYAQARLYRAAPATIPHMRDANDASPHFMQHHLSPPQHSFAASKRAQRVGSGRRRSVGLEMARLEHVRYSLRFCKEDDFALHCNARAKVTHARTHAGTRTYDTYVSPL